MRCCLYSNWANLLFLKVELLLARSHFRICLVLLLCPQIGSVGFAGNKKPRRSRSWLYRSRIFRWTIFTASFWKIIPPDLCIFAPLQTQHFHKHWQFFRAHVSYICRHLPKLMNVVEFLAKIRQFVKQFENRSTNLVNYFDFFDILKIKFNQI